MPRLRKTENDLANEYFRKRVAQQRIEFGISVPELANAMQRSMRTVYNRLEKPEDMTLKEFRAIAQKLHFTADEVARIVGVEL